MGYLKDIISIKTAFGPNLVSKHGSEFPVFVKIYLFFKLCHFPLCVKFYTPNIGMYLLIPI
jgi:hypothetical protein